MSNNILDLPIDFLFENGQGSNEGLFFTMLLNHYIIDTFPQKMNQLCFTMHHIV